MEETQLTLNKQTFNKKTFKKHIHGILFSDVLRTVIDGSPAENGDVAVFEGFVNNRMRLGNFRSYPCHRERRERKRA